MLEQGPVLEGPVLEQGPVFEQGRAAHNGRLAVARSFRSWWLAWKRGDLFGGSYRESITFARKRQEKNEQRRGQSLERRR